MSTSPTSIGSTLGTLIETCEGGQKSFHAAAENVRNAGLKPLLTDLSMQRRYFADELRGLARKIGENLETNRRSSAIIHRGRTNLKAALASGDDRAILAECERSEDTAVAEYCEALEHDNLPATVRDVLQQQAMGVKAAHDRVHEMLVH